MLIQISWLLQKPNDLDLHCLQRPGISGFNGTRVKWAFRSQMFSDMFQVCYCLVGYNVLFGNVTLTSEQNIQYELFCQNNLNEFVNRVLTKKMYVIMSLTFIYQQSN